MQTVIISDISRLSLHDSSLETIIRHDNNLELTFDWASLDNYREQNVDESIIIGKTNMIVTGLHSEQFKIYDNKDNSKFFLCSLSDDIITKMEVIGTNNIDDDTKTVTIGGLYKESEMYHWTEWSFKYESCTLSWTSFVTYTEWQEGKLPAD